MSPELAGPLAALQKDRDPAGFFRRAPRIGVDRAVLERTGRAWVVTADMGWDDLGDWQGWARHLSPGPDGNVGVGVRVAVDAQGCVVHSPDKPVVLLGVQGLVVVECSDVLLVAGKDACQQVRELPALLAGKNLRKLT